MGRLLNNDTNYRVIAGEALVPGPVAIRNTDGKVYQFKKGVATDTYEGWVAQNVAAGEVAAIIRSGKVGGCTGTSLADGKRVAVDNTGKLVVAAAGDTVVGFIPAGGTTGVEPTAVFIVIGESIPAAE